MRIARPAAALLSAASLALVAPAVASAEPGVDPAVPAVPAAQVAPEAGSGDRLAPIPAHPGSIIDTEALPLYDKEHWESVTAWTWNSPWLTGVEICSPFGNPPADAKGADGKPSDPPRGDTQHVVLVPGWNAEPTGWTATLSFTPYASREDAIGALNSYKRYLEACPLVDNQSKTQNDGGVARNDPTLGHALLVTNGFYLSTFAAVLPEGLIELAYHDNVAVPQVGMVYDPSKVFAALRGATVRGSQIGYPGPRQWRPEPAPDPGPAPAGEAPA